MPRFDRIIVAIVLALGLTIAGLSVAMARIGPTIENLSTASTLDGTSVNSPIGLTFSAPMNLRSVERNFRLSPRVNGSFSWAGNEMLFLPRKPLAYGTTYHLTVGTGASDTDGHRLNRTYAVSFTTQHEHLLYLGTSGSRRNRLVLATLTGREQIIGPNDDLVTGFGVSQDRTLVSYVKRGTPGERTDELWLLSLGDNSTQLLFRKPDWTISQPAISPDDRYIVFLATNVRVCTRYYRCYRDTSTPLVYLYDLHSKKVFPFRSNNDVPLTDFITFSPSGQIAYTDLGSPLTLADPNGQHVLHIPAGNNSLSFWGFDATGNEAAFVGQTPSSTGGDVLIYRGGHYTDVSQGLYDSSTPAISNSGTYVAFATYRGERGIEPIYGIDIADLKTKNRIVLTTSKHWTDWAPAWSPDDRYLAFVRSAPQEAMYLGSGEIWVMRANGHDARPLGGIGKDVTWLG